VLEGLLVAGRYRLLSPLGRGGHAEVYRAVHLATDVPVALKLLRPTLHGDPELARRFDREARQTTRLRHPNTVRVTDTGALDDGTRFIVMELVDGAPLSRVVAEEGPLPVARAARIVAQILKSAGEAHDLGLVHRDLKPANVLLTEHFGEPDYVKVVDFGVCRAEDGESLTTGDALLGTPAWMAPEQWLSAEVDARTDLYAIGAILFYLLTGAPPFGDTPSGPQGAMTQMNAHLAAPAPRLEDHLGEACPEALARLVARLLAKAPRERPATAMEALEALMAATSEDGAGARAGAPDTGKRRPWASWAGALAAGALVAGAAFAAGWWAAPDAAAPEQARPAAHAGLAPAAEAIVPERARPTVGLAPAAEALAPKPSRPTAELAPAAEAVEVVAAPGLHLVAPAATPIDEPAPAPTAADPPALVLRSMPRGARVTVVETGEELAAETPAEAPLGELARERLALGASVTLEFRRAGHLPHRHTLRPSEVDAGAPIVAPLRPRREPAADVTPSRTLPPLRTP